GRDGRIAGVPKVHHRPAVLTRSRWAIGRQCPTIAPVGARQPEPRASRLVSGGAMDGDTRLELGLGAVFGLATLVMVGLWRNGTIGGFVLLVSFGATILWALWIGWRPSGQGRHVPTGPDRRPRHNPETATRDVAA